VYSCLTLIMSLPPKVVYTSSAYLPINSFGGRSLHPDQVSGGMTSDNPCKLQLAAERYKDHGISYKNTLDAARRAGHSQWRCPSRWRLFWLTGTGFRCIMWMSPERVPSQGPQSGIEARAVKVASVVLRAGGSNAPRRPDPLLMTGDEVMTVLEQMNHFSDRFGEKVIVNSTTWRYYRLGVGAPIFWLTGGLRRAALGFAFMEKLAIHHTVIAPDYPPVQSIDEFITAFDTILQTEGVDTFALGGQSYGGLLAHAYLAHKPKAVERLILSSTGPADYGKGWLPVEHICIALARLLPEKTVKNLLAGGLLKVITVPEAERAEWVEAVHTVMQNDLSRADVVSHFAIAADVIRKGIVTPAAYHDWTGRIIVLSAENDPTQSKKDVPRYAKLFGRAVEVFSMGDLGHTALLFNPDKYVELLEQALV
jgi:pimeloyl-ACP methyl ester carboxylesterase